jgi:hypothetical protein
MIGDRASDGPENVAHEGKVRRPSRHHHSAPGETMQEAVHRWRQVSKDRGGSPLTEQEIQDLAQRDVDLSWAEAAAAAEVHRRFGGFGAGSSEPEGSEGDEGADTGVAPSSTPRPPRRQAPSGGGWDTTDAELPDWGQNTDVAPDPDASSAARTEHAIGVPPTSVRGAELCWCRCSSYFWC